MKELAKGLWVLGGGGQRQAKAGAKPWASEPARPNSLYPSKQQLLPASLGGRFSGQLFSKTSRDNNDIPAESLLGRKHFSAYKALSLSLTCLSLAIFTRQVYCQYLHLPAEETGSGCREACLHYNW